MMPADAGRTYEEWRELWLRGRESHAVQTLRFHGLRTALERSGRRGVGKRPRRPAAAPAVVTGVSVGEALVAEAARQLRQLLGGGVHG